MDGRIEAAQAAYERAVFGGDQALIGSAERGLDCLEADAAMVRGQLLHAKFLSDQTEDPRELELFERAAELYRLVGDLRGEGEALFWIGCVHQVVRGDHEKALPDLERSRALADEADDELTMSYALRHLGFVYRQSGRLDAAVEALEESTRLRRGLEFPAGVAANLVALAYLATEQDRRDDALGLLEAADRFATTAQAHAVGTWIAEARAHLSL